VNQCKPLVHDLPDEFHKQLADSNRRCHSDQYGTEIRFHRNLMNSPVRTLVGRCSLTPN